MTPTSGSSHVTWDIVLDNIAVISKSLGVVRSTGRVASPISMDYSTVLLDNYTPAQTPSCIMRRFFWIHVILPSLSVLAQGLTTQRNIGVIRLHPMKYAAHYHIGHLYNPVNTISLPPARTSWGTADGLLGHPAQSVIYTWNHRLISYLAYHLRRAPSNGTSTSDRDNAVFPRSSQTRYTDDHLQARKVSSKF